jgi:pimeloyl-ACP methyl ester carboxylesterase
LSGDEARKRSAWLAGGAGLTAVATPDEYSRKTAACMPQAELVIVTGASHLALLDKPDAINDGLARLVDRVTPSRYRRFRDRFRRAR